MTCKAIHKPPCILVTNTHSDRNFVISFLNSCSLPIISFFIVIVLTMLARLELSL